MPTPSRAQTFRLPFCDGKALSIESPNGNEVARGLRADVDLFAITQARWAASSAELMLDIGHAPNARHSGRASTAKAAIAGHPVALYLSSEQIECRTL